MYSKKYVIIVAGGKGNRMNSVIPKQFMLLHNKPVLMHTIERFYGYEPEIEIRLVLPDAHREFWKELCNKHGFKVKHTVVSGGNERYFSVKNALMYEKCTGLVAVHDGVRPLVSRSVIQNCFEQAQIYGAALPVIQISESLRRVNGKNNYAKDRANYRIVQTPQVFKSEIIIRAYEQPYSDKITDDATLVETLGHRVFLIEGCRKNIKITTKEDLAIAEHYFNLQ